MTYWIHLKPKLNWVMPQFITQITRVGIAEAFLAEFERVKDILVKNQTSGPHSDFGFRVYHFERFPYSVVYEESPNGPQIYAVAHQHREPGYWLSRA